MQNALSLHVYKCHKFKENWLPIMSQFWRPIFSSHYYCLLRMMSFFKLVVKVWMQFYCMFYCFSWRKLVAEIAPGNSVPCHGAYNWKRSIQLFGEALRGSPGLISCPFLLYFPIAGQFWSKCLRQIAHSWYFILQVIDITFHSFCCGLCGMIRNDMSQEVGFWTFCITRNRVMLCFSNYF